jgi:hypothetical protein
VAGIMQQAASRPYRTIVLSPAVVPATFDANAFDAREPDDLKDVQRLIILTKLQKVRLIAVYSVRRELQHPNTPADVKEEGLSQLFTIQTSLTPAEMQLRARVATIMRGNAASDAHAADAEHIAEAAKYSGYFITFDKRILKKREKLEPVLPPSLRIVTLPEFLSACDHFGIR